MSQKVSIARILLGKMRKGRESGQDGLSSKTEDKGWITATNNNGRRHVDADIPAIGDSIAVNFSNWILEVTRTDDGGFDVVTGDKTMHVTEYTAIDYTDDNGLYYTGSVNP